MFPQRPMFPSLPLEGGDKLLTMAHSTPTVLILGQTDLLNQNSKVFSSVMHVIKQRVTLSRSRSGPPIGRAAEPSSAEPNILIGAFQPIPRLATTYQLLKKMMSWREKTHPKKYYDDE